MIQDKPEDDVALTPNNADPTEEICKHIRPEVLGLYDVYSYRHAAAILKMPIKS